MGLHIFLFDETGYRVTDASNRIIKPTSEQKVKLGTQFDDSTDNHNNRKTKAEFHSTGSFRLLAQTIFDWMLRDLPRCRVP